MLTISKLATDKDLEGMNTARPEMISSGWMLIGRQMRTSFGGIIDLLALAPDGSLAYGPSPHPNTEDSKTIGKFRKHGHNQTILYYCRT